MRETFRACGVVAVEGALGDGFVERLHQDLDDTLHPYLESRRSIRETLRTAMVSRRNLRTLWQTNRTLQRELLLAAGNEYKERDDGRIDLRLPWRQPFNNSALLLNPFIFGALRSLLGESVELKSAHAIHALSAKGGGGSTGHVEQHWHRDTGLLFAPDSDFHLSDVHKRESGVHLPPYAINAFIPLVPFSEENGPTEFTLGSHLWGDVWADDEEAEAPLIDHRFLVRPGTIILSDYRTIHRGTVNRSPLPRPMLMLIYGRDWWTDVINYGMGDYGGVNTAKARSRARSSSQPEVESTVGPDSARSPLARAKSHALLQSTPVRAHESSVVSGEPTLTGGRAEVGEPPVPSLSEMMYWGLSTLWERGLTLELQEAFASQHQSRVP
mmetsp:Transcript_23745/g.69527  ORF Transcript_23745/g.69527 Transcript_23745/m.69527 type:complete len:384 (-) Transcript_23745:11-1162(-)